MTNICASIDNLCQIKDVTEELAQKIRFIWKAPDRATLEKAGYGYSQLKLREFRRMLINELIDAADVEYLGFNRNACEHVYYCNGGDTYATTILFTANRLTVGCIGDLVERNLIKDINNDY